MRAMPCVVSAELDRHLRDIEVDERWAEAAADEWLRRYLADPAMVAKADDWTCGTADHYPALESLLADFGQLDRAALDSPDARAMIERLHGFGVAHARARAAKLREWAEEAAADGRDPFGEAAA